MVEKRMQVSFTVPLVVTMHPGRWVVIVYGGAVVWESWMVEKRMQVSFTIPPLVTEHPRQWVVIVYGGAVAVGIIDDSGS
jgi:hypothetical protein